MASPSDKDANIDSVDPPSSQHTLDASRRDTISSGNDEEAAKGLTHEVNYDHTVNAADPNVVGWDGPNDPACPMNWSQKKKWANILSISGMTLLTPLGSSMFAPGVPDIMGDFDTANPNMATFVVSVYVLGFAFGPLIAAPMSEIYGRRSCYNISNVLFIVFTVATALSTNMVMLIAFRFLMGFAGSTPITNGSGTIADLFRVEQRGKAMAVWAVGPMLGPCVGPVAGGFISQIIGWRWVFWIVTVAAGVISVGGFFINSETYHPVILQAKVRRLRRQTNNPNLRSALDHNMQSKSVQFRHAIVRPTKLLCTHLPVILLSLYISVAYGILYLLFTTFTFVFTQQYDFSTGIVGLTFAPTGIGMILGIVTFGALSDMIIKKKQARNEEPVPEDRLPIRLTTIGGLCIPVSLIWYGWAIEGHTHWIVPMIGVVMFCFGLMGVMMCAQTYLLDSYIEYAASVVAAVTVLRSIMGALLPLGGLDMYGTLGLGWGNTLLAFISLALVPVPALFRIYGPRIRAKAPKNLA